jgi:hypothetical protein
MTVGVVLMGLGRGIVPHEAGSRVKRIKKIVRLKVILLKLGVCTRIEWAGKVKRFWLEFRNRTIGSSGGRGYPRVFVTVARKGLAGGGL